MHLRGDGVTDRCAIAKRATAPISAAALCLFSVTQVGFGDLAPNAVRSVCDFALFTTPPVPDYGPKNSPASAFQSASLSTSCRFLTSFPPPSVSVTPSPCAADDHERTAFAETVTARYQHIHLAGNHVLAPALSRGQFAKPLDLLYDFNGLHVPAVPVRKHLFELAFLALVVLRADSVGDDVLFLPDAVLLHLILVGLWRGSPLRTGRARPVRPYRLWRWLEDQTTLPGERPPCRRTACMHCRSQSHPRTHCLRGGLNSVGASSWETHGSSSS